MPILPKLDHGVIGNGQVLALVSPDTSIQWLCMPRFDSPSVFGSILDKKIGGTWRFVPQDVKAKFSMAYLENTNVLRTEVRASEGAVEILDFAPRIPRGLSMKTNPEICRLIRPIKGGCRLTVDFDPRPDYGRRQVRYVTCGHTVEVTSGHEKFYLTTNVPAAFVLNKQTITVDQPIFFSFRYQQTPDHDSIASIQKALNLTVLGWRTWARTCALPSFAQRHVLRSALCLKLEAVS